MRAGVPEEIKVEEPQQAQWEMPLPGQILFTCLPRAPDPAQAAGLPAISAESALRV